jgi:hypothetical protein
VTVPTEFLSPEQRQAAFEQCNSQVCQTAVARLTTARNAIPAICNDIAAWASARTFYTATAATAYAASLAAAVAAAAATASIIGIPLATILWVAAGVMLALALTLTALAINAAIQYGNAQNDLNNAQTEFSAALADARTKCGPYCNIGDTKLPTCS